MTKRILPSRYKPWSKWIKKFTILLAVFWYFFFALPNPLFKAPTSTMLLSKENQLLGGVIAADEQWRFPPADSVSYKVAKCIVYYEDEYFYCHPGFNPVSLARAIVQNIRKKRIVSGASTLTMQTVRMAKSTPQRNYFQKIIELVLSTRLELKYSKQEILNLYLSNAPFGGNVVGIDAAAWRYYKRLSHELSWSEAATLAVLPNAPSLIFPGKNQDKLRKKRNKLLLKLHRNKVIDALTYQLAITEPLPAAPNPVPQIAPHLVQWAKKEHPGKRINASISMPIQNHANQVIEKHYKTLRKSEIHNIAAIIVNVKTNEILAYVGNTNDPDLAHGNNVDIIQAPRSSGSILKPFLYEQMLSDGLIYPKMLVPDIPFNEIKNYNENYDGAVPANEALARSLNIPAAILLSKYGLTKFKSVLQKNGFQGFTKSSEHYGLSMIIGGGEVTLFELAQAYTNMANRVQEKNYQFKPINYLAASAVENTPQQYPKPYATYLTLKALKEVVRPQSETGWQNFEGAQVAWKTGTSHGFKDAWAVGISPDIVAAVWVGNADGEGRPEMTGTKIAAPILFDLLDYFRPLNQFKAPAEKLVAVKVCSSSGYPVSKHCNALEIEILPTYLQNFSTCPFHQTLFLDTTGTFRVNSSCYPVHLMQQRSQFVLPPKIAWFYAQKNPSYISLPAYLPDCAASQKLIELIYPKKLSSIYIPRDLMGIKQSVIFEAVHANTDARLFWHIDSKFITETKGQHKLALQPAVGKHQLLITDQMGNELVRSFEVVK